MDSTHVSRRSLRLARVLIPEYTTMNLHQCFITNKKLTHVPAGHGLLIGLVYFLFYGT